MCGVTALLLQESSNQLASSLRASLAKIQHRGYDGAGIAVDSTEGIVLKKGQGLISEVLTDQLLSELPTERMGLAHTRYKTIGECTTNASQPLLNQQATMCLVHNGQIDAANDLIPDSLKILRELQHRLPYYPEDFVNLTDNQIFGAVDCVLKIIKGAYSCVLMIHGLGLVAFRDPHGIRPLLYSTNVHGDHLIASEDVAIRTVPSFKLSFVKDLRPGECLILRLDGSLNTRELIKFPKYTPCIFEYIYLAHHNSTLNGIDVRVARKKLGSLLADRIRTVYGEVHKAIDWIVPIPETSCLASQELAYLLDLPYLEVLKINPHRKKARTFILPTQEQRIKAITQKFFLDEDPVAREKLKGSHILLVDDSIVRGTTLRCVIKMMKEVAGVKEVSVASVSPAIKHRNIYGIDIPDSSLLIANGRDLLQIAQELGADRVIYQDLHEMVEHFLELGEHHGIVGFECSLFNGCY